jgi:hypothetical protein
MDFMAGLRLIFAAVWTIRPLTVDHPNPQPTPTQRNGLFSVDSSCSIDRFWIPNVRCNDYTTQLTDALVESLGIAGSGPLGLFR